VSAIERAVTWSNEHELQMVVTDVVLVRLAPEASDPLVA